MRNGIAARMSGNSRKMNPTQKQFPLNRGASEKQFPMNSFTPPQKQRIRNVSLFTLFISLLAGLMIVSLPNAVFAADPVGVATGWGWCGRAGHPSVKGDCPICVRNNRSQNYAPAPQQPTGPSQTEIAAQQAEEERQRQQVETDRIEREAAEQRAIAADGEQKRHAQFQSDKANALKSIKGVNPTGSQLKSAGYVQDYSSGGFGLKGIGDTDIKNVQQDRDVRDLGGTDAAWKQLNAAAYLAGLSVRNSSDPVESAYMAEQAARAMNGDPLGVVVPAAEARPGAARSGASGTAYQAVTKHIMGELKTRTAELAEKKKKVVELNQQKETAKKETQVARDQVEKLELELKQPKPPAVAATAPPEADKAKDDTLAKAKDDALAKAKDDALAKAKEDALAKAKAKAKAALLAAQQSEAEITRAEERAISEAKFSEQKINSTIVDFNTLNANPNLAESMLPKFQPAPTTTPATNPTR
jgi:hypothetical protein